MMARERRPYLQGVGVHNEDEDVLGLGTEHEAESHAGQTDSRRRRPAAIFGTCHHHTGADIAGEAETGLDDGEQDNALALLEEVTGNAVGLGIKGGVEDMVGIPDHAFHRGSFGRNLILCIWSQRSTHK